MARAEERTVSSPAFLPAGAQTPQPHLRKKNSGEHASRGHCSAPCTHSPKQLQPCIACLQLCGGFFMHQARFLKAGQDFCFPLKKGGQLHQLSGSAHSFAILSYKAATCDSKAVLKQEAGLTERWPSHCKPGISNPIAHPLRLFIS